MKITEDKSLQSKNFNGKFSYLPYSTQPPFMNNNNNIHNPPSHFYHHPQSFYQSHNTYQPFAHAVPRDMRDPRLSMSHVDDAHSSLYDPDQDDNLNVSLDDENRGISLIGTSGLIRDGDESNCSLGNECDDDLHDSISNDQGFPFANSDDYNNTGGTSDPTDLLPSSKRVNTNNMQDSGNENNLDEIIYSGNDIDGNDGDDVDLEGALGSHLKRVSSGPHFSTSSGGSSLLPHSNVHLTGDAPHLHGVSSLHSHHPGLHGFYHAAASFAGAAAHSNSASPYLVNVPSSAPMPSAYFHTSSSSSSLHSQHHPSMSSSHHGQSNLTHESVAGSNHNHDHLSMLDNGGLNDAIASIDPLANSLSHGISGTASGASSPGGNFSRMLYHY